MTALLFAGRAGTSIAAEIGLMKATSQIEAMQLMAIDPVQRIALPRFLAGVISLPLLTAMFNAFAIMGAVMFSSVSWVWIREFSGASYRRVFISARTLWVASGKAWCLAAWSA